MKFIAATGILLLASNESVNALQIQKFASISTQVGEEEAEAAHVSDFSVFDDILKNQGQKKTDNQ